MGLSHRLPNGETIAILTNVEVRQQDIKLVSSYFGECLRYAGRDSYLKAAFL